MQGYAKLISFLWWELRVLARTSWYLSLFCLCLIVLGNAYVYGGVWWGVITVMFCFFFRIIFIHTKKCVKFNEVIWERFSLHSSWIYDAFPGTQLPKSHKKFARILSHLQQIEIDKYVLKCFRAVSNYFPLFFLSLLIQSRNPDLFIYICGAV